MRIFRGNKVVPLKVGTVNLTFYTHGNDSFVAADPVTRSLEVVDVNKSVWRQFRKTDVRYNEIESRFLDRQLLKNFSYECSRSKKSFQ